MSPDPAADASRWAPEREARRAALRIAVAAALGFAIAVARDQALPFLAPVFAVQLLAATPRAPTPAQGIGFAFAVTAASLVTLWLARILIDNPAACMLVLAAVFFFSFLLDARGVGGPLPSLLLITNAAMPVLTLQSPELAAEMAELLIDGGCMAVLLAWTVHALFPSAAEATAPPRKAATAGMSPERFAFTNVLILMPLVVAFLVQGDEVSIVVLITAITVLRQPLPAGRRAAAGLLLGNVAGGVAALVAYQFVAVLPSAVFLCLVLLFVGLVLGGRIAAGGAMAPVHVVALATFLILLGIGLVPLSDGSGAAFVDRVVNVLLSVVYVVGAMSLLRGRERQPDALRAAP